MLCNCVKKQLEIIVNIGNGGEHLQEQGKKKQGKIANTELIPFSVEILN